MVEKRCTERSLKRMSQTGRTAGSVDAESKPPSVHYDGTSEKTVAQHTPNVVSLSVRVRPGIYWDEHNFERECAILELTGFGKPRRLDVLDAGTGKRILDPPSAIAVMSKPNR